MLAFTHPRSSLPACPPIPGILYRTWRLHHLQAGPSTLYHSSCLHSSPLPPLSPSVSSSNAPHHPSWGAAFSTILYPHFKKILFWLFTLACRTLAPLPGIEPVPPALRRQSFNQQTTREVPWFVNSPSAL